MHLQQRKTLNRYGAGILLAVAFLPSACSRRQDRPRSERELIRDLAASPDASAKISAARELAKFTDPASFHALTAALDDAIPAVEAAAAQSLGDTKNPAAPQALWDALRKPDRAALFRLAASSALAKFGDTRAVQPLIDLLPTRREEAWQALSTLDRAVVTPALASALRRPETRDSAESVLMITGCPVGVLIPLLSEQEGLHTRLAAARILAEADSSQADDALKAALKDSDLKMVAAAHRFLIRQGQPETEDRLIGALSYFGAADMAWDYIRSGNPALAQAGENWASAHNISMVAYTSDLPEVHWHETDSVAASTGVYHFDRSLKGTPGAPPVESSGISFVPGKWAEALSVAKGGILEYPVASLLDFISGTVEMWISPLLDGSDPIYTRYNHPLLLYQAKNGDQFVVSEGVFGGFYAGTVIKRNYVGAGGGSMKNWTRGTWHHLAFTYSTSPARQRFYIDGVVVATGNNPMPSPPLADGAVFTVGSDPWKTWSAFAIDDLEIAQEERSPMEIRRNALRADPLPDR